MREISGIWQNEDFSYQLTSVQAEINASKRAMLVGACKVEAGKQSCPVVVYFPGN